MILPLSKHIMNSMDENNNLSGFITFDTLMSAPSPTVQTYTSSLENKESNNNGFWKYNEDKTLKEVKDYIQSTYNAHYTSKESPTQVIDLIESIGDAEPFSRSNAIKYLSRFGKKNGKSRLDLLKAIHYSILLYHFSGLHNNTTDEYKTF